MSDATAITIDLNLEGEAMTVITKATRLNVDLRSAPAHITWNADRSGLLLRLSNGEVDLALDLGRDALAQVRQAPSWAEEDRSPELRQAG